MSGRALEEMTMSIKRLLLAVVVGIVLVPTVAQAQDEVVYYHTDAIGSVRAITDATGAVVGRYDFLPFGELWPSVPPAPAEVRQFAGKERDEESGLDYVGARYYASGNGRFTTVDPFLDIDQALVDPQRWNRYTYVRNNPLRYVDPDGRAIETLWDAFNIGLGFTSLVDNLRQGNFGSAAVDAGGLLLDSGAAVVPFLPGGVATAIKGARAVDKATVVYQSVKTGENAVQYVGITNNLSRRALEHLAEKGIKIEQIQKLGELSRGDARAVEQALIEIHKLGKEGGTLLNKINSISRSNPQYADRLKRGLELLDEVGYGVQR